MKKNEQDEDKVIDSISFLDDNDLIVHEKKKKIAVQTMNAESEIVDIWLQDTEYFQPVEHAFIEWNSRYLSYNVDSKMASIQPSEQCGKVKIEWSADHKRWHKWCKYLKIFMF